VREGELVSLDAVALWEAAGRPGTLAQVCPQRFAAPLAPHLAARAEGRRVDRQLLREGINFWRATSDIVLVEGAGGLMSPVCEEDYNADLAAEFGYPLVVISANELGTINATLQTMITASVYKKGTFYFFDDAGGFAFEPRGGKVECPLFVAGIVLNTPANLRDDVSVHSNRDELERRCVAPVLAAVQFGGGFDRRTDWFALARNEKRGDGTEYDVQSTKY